MEYTGNFQLSQWERTDRIQMQDFNADNAKIDAALAAHAAALALKGNCQLWRSSYTGKGGYGADKKNSITFPWTPDMALVIGAEGEMMPLIPGTTQTAFHAGSCYGVYLTWSGLKVSWYSLSDLAQMNFLNRRYYIYALRILS